MWTLDGENITDAEGQPLWADRGGTGRRKEGVGDDTPDLPRTAEPNGRPNVGSCYRQTGPKDITAGAPMLP